MPLGRCERPAGTVWAHERFKNWSRREDLNAPSAENNSAALTLSYTSIKKVK